MVLKLLYEYHQCYLVDQRTGNFSNQNVTIEILFEWQIIQIDLMNIYF